MELIFDGKKNEQDIISISKKQLELKIEKDKSYLFKGDNALVLSQLLNGGTTVDLVYIDPPFNTNQEFVASSERISTISRTKDGIVAYSDTMDEEQYLEFIRERLILLREIMSEEGSIYFHIDNKIGHYIKILMDEVFGRNNFRNDISRIKSNPKNFSRRAYGNQKDMVLFYTKNYKKNIFNNVNIELSEEDKTRMFKKIDVDGRRYNTVPVHAPGETKNGPTGQEWKGMMPPKGRHWRTDPKELDLLDEKGLIEWSKNGVPRIKKFADEHKGKKIQDFWEFKDPAYPIYPTEKNLDMLKLIVSQSSKPDSIVLDCFAGGGTTLKAAELLNRKWIGIDKSDIAIDTIRNQMNNYDFEYIEISKDMEKLEADEEVINL